LGKIIVLPNFVYFPMADSASPPIDLANRYDVAIIGGGITGCAIARELSRYACRTILLERDIEVALAPARPTAASSTGGTTAIHRP
jgi:glycine/D-amino acid oxidase-like deaminating enzyme